MIISPKKCICGSDRTLNQYKCIIKERYFIITDALIIITCAILAGSAFDLVKCCSEHAQWVLW